MSVFYFRLGSRSFVECYRLFEQWEVGFKITRSGILISIGAYALNFRWWVR